MLRTEALEALARNRDDALTLPTMQAVAPWNSLGQADERNFSVTGCMGAAASIALGLAIAQPRERVVVIDGDGSLVMQLGSLISIAEAATQKLFHIVMENGIYETSGGQTVPGQKVSDLCSIALACGYTAAHRLSSVQQIDEEMPAIFASIGPIFVSLAIVDPGVITNPVDPRELPLKPAQARNMRAGLGRQPDVTNR